MEIALVIATVLTAFGTLALAYATFRLANRTGEMAEQSHETVEENRKMVEANREMVEEIREARIAEERPHVIVDTDHSEPPMVDVVLRNIGKGAAKDITFEFSATMEAPESINNPLWVPVTSNLTSHEA
jgi:hypothetical protein